MKQLAKWGPQTHNIFKWFSILAEEVGELAKAALEGDEQGVIDEATDVAAVAVAIITTFRTNEPS